MFTKNRAPMLWIFALSGIIVFMMLLIPIINVFFITSPQDFVSAFLSWEVESAILLSFYTAAVATMIVIIFGTPLAYLLARYDFPFKKTIDSSLELPILLPHTVAGIALLTVFGEYGPIGSFLLSYGIRFVDTIFGIIVAQLFVSAPFYIKTVEESFIDIDPRYHYVARTLGARPFKAFLYIELPLAFRSMITGSVLCWARAISEFGAVIILAYYPPTAPVLIYQKFVLYGLSAVLPITAVLIAITLVIFALIKFIQLREGEQ